jgi:hypothetical protein
MKFKKTMTLLLVYFIVASLAATAVSTSHSDGKSSTSYNGHMY